MPFARPTLTQLRAQIWADMQAQAGNLLPMSVLWCLSWAQAGMASLHYGFLDRIATEATPWGATAERMLAWFALKGGAALPATLASGTWGGSGVPGSVIANGSSITRSDGFAYVTTALATVDGGGNVVVPIQALAAGALGNAASGAALTLGSGASGVNAGGVAASAITGGTDAETEAATRTRMLLAYASPPQGGAMSDYLEWALAVPGVTRAWVAPNATGPGTVTVYTMFDLAEVAHDGFPQGTNGVASSETRAAAATGDQLAVADAIYPLRPVTALVYSCAPTAYPVNVTISDLYPDTSALRAAVTSALHSAFFRVGTVGGSAWPVGSAGAANGSVYPSDLTDALAAVPGLVRYTIVSPASAVTAPAGGLPMLGTVVFA